MASAPDRHTCIHELVHTWSHHTLRADLSITIRLRQQERREGGMTMSFTHVRAHIRHRECHQETEKKKEVQKQRLSLLDDVAA